MRDLLIRLALGSPCLGIAVWVMLQPSGNLWINMLGVFPCVTAFALIVTPSSNDIIAGLWRVFFMPDREAQPRPDTKRAATLHFRQQHEAALVEYERLLQLFPNDLELWNKVFEITLVDLRDPEQAASLVNQARTRIPPETHRRLQHLFSIQTRRYRERAQLRA